MKKTYLMVFVAAAVLSLGVSVVLYPQLPSLIPVHWNAHGEADGWGPRAAVFVHTAVLIAVGLLLLALPKISPRRFAVESFESTFWFSGMAVVCLLGYLQGVHLVGAMRGGFPVDRAMLGGVGLFFVLAGNVMGKVRRNFWLGVRTPWTLANERVWYATHRLAARTMVIGGLLVLAVALAGWPTPLAVAALVGAALMPAGYSLVYYKRLERQGTLEA